MRILRQFDPTSNMGQIVDAAATINIGQKLNGRRYLIVLDNVWSRQVYTLIANHLPNQGAGSRIIITSRNSNLADQPDYTHKLDGLINEEAEELFLRRLVPQRQGSYSLDEYLPENLRGMSKKILDKCDRLPLAVAAIGSSLSNKPMSESVWKKFHDSLASEMASGSEHSIIGSILRPSFVDLPDNLKSCFLYFSIFPEDQPISRGRLIRSWLAEGFIEEKKGKTPEEVAETYLDELIRRSLVRVCTSEIDDRVKTCHVLRLYHEFIVPLSVNGNFVTVVDHKSKSISPGEKVRRLSFHEQFPTKLSEISDSKHVRTLFVFGHMDELTKDMISLRSRYIRKNTGSSTAVKVFDKFRLLKVLDLQEVPLQELPKKIGSFVLLKCLNLRRTRIETVPDSIAKLYLLETLDLKYTLVKELPKWIHKLKKLRHLLVSCGEAQGAKVSSAIGSLSSLQKMSLIVVDKDEDIVKLGNLVQLRKLGLADLEKKFGSKLCETIQKMENLSKFDVRAKTGEFLWLEQMETPPKNIQRLHLKGRLQRLPSWISLLSSLVKVVLKCSKLSSHQNPLEMLEGLSSLMELEMIDYYIGIKLVFKARSFKNLRKLHVEQFDELIEVVVEDMALSMLKRLTICKCKQLKPLTPRLSLGQLEELELYDMSDAFLSDIQRRIHQGELVDHIQEPVPSSSSTTERGISTEIRSYRHIS
ncbi:NB-ARC domain, LRR domain containing protein [Parasponia andersonii]|uniref:NB-ARC domain, LRR domain containing protein n=1 Tax=Parasponia andersonii TaxID=3476 RepID=A0A2P5BEV8_PARAD|nr:NB-ARC domain, LRR domain containing protein [Parasponia andersonii]